ncbi:tetratricopeptide repeat protein [Ramlibacter albus]|uniref:Tetratricopeptide repeat protein n=1 Tax=Ramlibacter albus TaxID=2079448 RepID=A0A923M616_9BURK|nr:tetratricopeptide repeat protein [Ramlibacter albus]MBC5764610.1 tetratricopeptide repeat protein [Ramlibacter albus]
MVIDVAPLWDFSKPEVSEQRFRDALATAQGDDVLVLQTQIARTYGIRKDFVRAREVLRVIEPAIARSGPEAQARYWLELGRTWSSATHPKESQTPEAVATARAAFQKSLDIARAGALDALAIDAIHMFAFLDTAPADQLKWGREALAVVLASQQPAAQRWQASVRNNIGYALHQLGRYDEALAEFRQALALREQSGNARSIRVARWMVAWTLRALKRDDEALAMQLALERENAAAGEPDEYVFEELAHLYRAKGDEARAAYYSGLHKARAKQ